LSRSGVGTDWGAPQKRGSLCICLIANVAVRHIASHPYCYPCHRGVVLVPFTRISYAERLSRK